jgi:F-type H+-transporting ATPase subunit b
MRRLAFVVLLLIVLPAYVFAQPANDVAHGSEKAAHEVAHPNEEHGGAHEEPKFLGLPAWIFKLVNMIAFIWVLWYFLAGPVKKAFADRHTKVRAEAEEARARRAKSDQLAADIEARLKQIEEDVRSIRERAVADGERQKRELIAAAEAEAQKILQSARNEVDNRVKHARQELTEYAGQLASDRAEQLLRENITDDDRRKLFAESVREVSQA